MMVIVEQLAGETEVLGENLTQYSGEAVYSL
jgi:hypothetical protein